MAFIYLTLTAVMLYGMNVGVIPSNVFYGVTSVLSIAVLLTLIVRYQYTSKTRDNHLWNRRRFAKMGGPPTTMSCDAILAKAADDSAKYGAAFKKTATTAYNKIDVLTS
jgi:hypothetical protein